MRCAECDRPLDQSVAACVCGWRVPTLVVANDWIVQTCSRLGCTSAIRSRAGSQSPLAPVCKWCQCGTAHSRFVGSPPRPHDGPAVSLGEFGEQLYQAIVLKTGLDTVRQGQELARMRQREDRAERLAVVAQTIERSLMTVLDHAMIEPDDVRRILEIGVMSTEEG